MSHEVESLAYREQNGVPWHRLGTPFTERITAAQAIQIAKGDYDVIKAPLFAAMGGEFVPTPSAALFSNYSGNWEYLNSIKKGEKYEPVQNRQIAELLDTGDEDNLPLTELFEMDVMGVLSGSKRSFFCLRMGEDTVKYGVDGDDHYVTHLHIYNDFTGNGALHVAISLIRSVCLNTITLAVNAAAEDNTLWTFSHKSMPLERLAFRLEFERNIQNARRKFYAELEAMTQIGFSETKLNAFAEMLFPVPPVPGKVKEAAMARDDMRQSIVAPVLELGEQSNAQWECRRAAALENQKGFLARTEEYREQLGGLTLYTAFNMGTDYINWRLPERGDWVDAAESIMFGNRSLELDRLAELSHAIMKPGNPKMEAKYKIQKFLNLN